jgi:hypothetical protein
MARETKAPGDLRPLIEVAAQHGLSYNVLLRAVMTHACRGERRGRSWLADPQDAARWKREREAAPAGAEGLLA